MKCLLVSANKFEGKAEFSKIPLSMTDFDVSDTRLSGTFLLFPGVDLKAGDCDVEVFEPVNAIDASIPGTTLLTRFSRDYILKGDHVYFLERWLQGETNFFHKRI